MFSKKRRKIKLQRKFEKLMEESHRLLKTNRRESDEKMAEAEAVLRIIDAIDQPTLDA
ncbi:MAG: Lacal_2735 family protein [Mariniblastus sp.]|nr:Lacal_2735 family protein [Mariniblastus sp.]